MKGRLDTLIEDHETGLEQLREVCREPMRVVDVFPALFKSKITDSNLIMATGETISHLNYLYYEGDMEVNVDTNGVRWYQNRS